MCCAFDGDAVSAATALPARMTAHLPYERRRHRHHHCGKHVGHAEGFAPDEVDAHAEDEDRPDRREVGDRRRRHKGLQETGKHGNDSLQDGDGDDRENAALAHGCGHGAHEERIDGTFKGQGRPVARESILDGADDGHGAHRNGERGGDEGIDKARVAVAARGVFEPFPKSVQLALEVDSLAYEGPKGERDDHEGRVDGRQLAAFYGEHAGERSRETHEQNSDGGCLEQRVLYALCEEPSEGEAREAADEDESAVDEGTESYHGVLLRIELHKIVRH